MKLSALEERNFFYIFIKLDMLSEAGQRTDSHLTDQGGGVKSQDLE